MKTNRIDGMFRGAALRQQRGWVLTALTLSVALICASSARAQELSLIGANNPAVPSSFTFNFGEFGGVASANITFTDIELVVNPDIGEARFVRYYQEVEPLTLPGGFSTGNLIIEIVEGSSVGTFDETIGEFNTEEVYAIYFAGDLSAFGLESPVYLPSGSTGNVILDTETGGTISLDWAGEGELRNPADPTTTVNFEYACSVNASFEPAPITMVRLAMIPEVESIGLPRGIERSLSTRLFGVVDDLDAGNTMTALRRLASFSRTVNALSGRRIAEEDATRLLDMSGAITTMIMDGDMTSGASIRTGKGLRWGR